MQILEQIYPLQQYQVIVANGEFPKAEYLQQLIQNATRIICCDGAIHKLLQNNFNPDHIIGDCDSLEMPLNEIFMDKIIRIADQNTNDLTKAVNFAKDLKQQIIILGASGLREDHTIANIALLGEYIKEVDSIAIISECGIFTAHNYTSKLASLPGQQISLFTIDPQTTINCKELKWPLIDHQFKSWYNGTLNQATGNEININTNGTVIVYRAFDIK